MASTSQAATHSPAFHSTIHSYSINPSGDILTPRTAPVAATGPRSDFLTLVVNNDKPFDKDKDHKVDNGGDRSGNDAACAPRECTTAEALAACELLQPVILEDRKPIEVATVSERNQVDCTIEQDKVPDNSGHGKSIENTSIHGDDRQPESQSSANTPMSLDGLPSELYCNCCQKNWKNKSELKKHLNRRSKPFRCNREECTKNQVGFASNPDLTRHKRTVHGDNLKGKTYICTNGGCAKDDPPKRWPRADNFRVHLKGVHKIEQVSDTDLQHYSASAESVADGEQFVALDDDTENEKGGVEITEDKFIEHLNGLARAKQLELLALVPATVLQEALRQKGGKVVCNICGTVFTRPCELRKHSKRHKKPYGCTFYRCEKTFGSKDDWKRHERQQHTPPEVWVCEKNCGGVFGSRDLFELHLEDSHHEMSPPTKEAKLEDNRQNMHSASSFWCGFCCCTVRFVSDTSDPQNIRFDHIDDHFMGRRDQPEMNISQWLHMENPPTEREVTIVKRAPSSQGNVRKRKLRAASDARSPKQLRSSIV